MYNEIKKRHETGAMTLQDVKTLWNGGFYLIGSGRWTVAGYVELDLDEIFKLIEQADYVFRKHSVVSAFGSDFGEPASDVLATEASTMYKTYSGWKERDRCIVDAARIMPDDSTLGALAGIKIESLTDGSPCLETVALSDEMAERVIIEKGGDEPGLTEDDRPGIRDLPYPVVIEEPIATDTDGDELNVPAAGGPSETTMEPDALTLLVSHYAAKSFNPTMGGKALVSGMKVCSLGTYSDLVGDTNLPFSTYLSPGVPFDGEIPPGVEDSLPEWLEGFPGKDLRSDGSVDDFEQVDADTRIPGSKKTTKVDSVILSATVGRRKPKILLDRTAYEYWLDIMNTFATDYQLVTLKNADQHSNKFMKAGQEVYFVSDKAVMRLDVIYPDDNLSTPPDSSNDEQTEAPATTAPPVPPADVVGEETLSNLPPLPPTAGPPVPAATQAPTAAATAPPAPPAVEKAEAGVSPSNDELSVQKAVLEFSKEMDAGGGKFGGVCPVLSDPEGAGILCGGSSQGMLMARTDLKPGISLKLTDDGGVETAPTPDDSPVNILESIIAMNRFPTEVVSIDHVPAGTKHEETGKVFDGLDTRFIKFMCSGTEYWAALNDKILIPANVTDEDIRTGLKVVKELQPVVDGKLLVNPFDVTVGMCSLVLKPCG